MTDRSINLGRTRLLQAGLLISLLLASNYFSVLSIFSNRMMSYLGIGDMSLAFMFSVSFAVSLFPMFFIGGAVAKWGTGRVIRTCLAGIGVSMLLIGVAGPNWRVVTGAKGLHSFFAAPLNLAVQVYLCRLFPRQQRRILSISSAATSAGSIGYPLLAEGLLYITAVLPVIGFAAIFHLPFLLLGIPLLLFGLFKFRGGSRSPSDRNTSLMGNFRQLCKGPTLLLILLLSLHSTADCTLHIWMPRFLGSQSFTLRQLPPGLVMSANSLVYLVARGLLAMLPEGVGQRKLIVLPGLLGGLLFAFCLPSHDYRLVAGGYLLSAFIWSLEYPAQLSCLAGLEKERLSSAFAMVSIISSGLTFVTLNLTGFLATRLREADMWQAVLPSALLFVLVGLGGALYLRLTSRSGESLQPDRET